MTSLLDIGPLTEEVSVGGKPVSVFGITPEGFFYLLNRFPMLQQIFGKGVKGITMEMLREAAPSSIAYTIALATTDRSIYDENVHWLNAVQASANVAMNLSAHYQMALFQAALRLTFPDGLGPFMAGVEGLANSINLVSGGRTVTETVPATTSSKPSRSGFTTDSRGMRLGAGAPQKNSRHSKRSGLESILAKGQTH